MKRLWKLKPSSKLNTDFYVFDVETAHKKSDGYYYWCLRARPENFVFGIIYGHGYKKVIKSVHEFKKVLLEKRFEGRKVFAHNAQYDLNTIYGNIYELDKEAIFNNKFISATNGNCTFADSMNIFVGLSVEKIGKMTGLHKGKLGGQGYRSKGITRKDIDYCIKDCEIVWNALFSAFEFAGEIRITQAALSLQYYRRFHQPYNIDFNECSKHFFNSYYGGRTEVFKMGKTYSTVIDVNSMYPFHLRNSIFPNPRTLKKEIDLSLSKFNKYLDWFEGYADCTVTHAKTWLGYLPYRKNDKLIFPVGTFRGSWNFPELRYAVETGIVEVVKVHSIVYGQPMQSPFVSFVDTLNEMKINALLSGNLWEADRAKRFSNSLYGKFGQRIDEKSIYISDIQKEFDKVQYYQRNKLFKKLVPFNSTRNDYFLVINNKKNITNHSIPCFASYVTSYGRLQLLKKLIEMKDKNVVYCDTDSIFFEINNNIQSEHDLGGWKIENKIVTEIKGLKNYKYMDGLTEIWRVKGVPVNKGRKVKIFEGDKEHIFDAVEQMNDNTFRYFNLIKSKEGLRRGLETGILTARIKKISGVYDKRTTLKHGKTEPIIV